MNGLKVYIDPKGRDAWCAIFYTRRAGGPFYRWRYEDLSGQWLSSRMHPCELPVTELVTAPWKEVPAALKSRLNGHYVD